MANRPAPPRARKARQKAIRNRSLTAAAENLQTRLDRLGGQAPDIGEAWQRDVWDLYDKVPELRTAARLTGGAMSQCRLTIARVQPNGEPVPLPDDEPHPAKDLLTLFAGGAGGQAALLDSIGVALTVPGETILVGALDPRDALKDDFLRMQAYSSEQVRQVNQNVTVRRDESTRSDRTIELTRGVVDPETEEEVIVQDAAAIRIWRPHPRFSWQADSAARAAKGVLAEIAMYDDHINAAGMSRLAGAGIFAVPEGMTLPGLAVDDEEADGDADPFMALLMQIMSLAIRDRESAAAMVPILLRGTPEDIAALKHLTFSTPFDDKVADLRDRAISRLGSAVDMPGEVLLGLGDTQGWVGSLITDDWKQNHLQTLMGLAVGSLTVGWLWPALAATGAGNVGSDIIVWFDDSSVRTRENTGPEALAAYTNGAIGGPSFRRAIGYGDGDAPDLESPEGLKEMAVQLLYKNPALAPLLLPIIGIDLTPDQVDAGIAIAAVLGGSAPEAGAPAGAAGLAPETGAAAIPQPRTAPETALRAYRGAVARGA